MISQDGEMWINKMEGQWNARGVLPDGRERPTTIPRSVSKSNTGCSVNALQITREASSAYIHPKFFMGHACTKQVFIVYPKFKLN